MTARRERVPASGGSNRASARRHASPKAPPKLPQATQAATAPAKRRPAPPTAAIPRDKLTATWTMNRVPSPTTWSTEFGGAQRKGLKWRSAAAETASGSIERNEERLEGIHKAFERRMFQRARNQLQHLATTKYGNVKSLFRMFDIDAGGTISFDEFSAAIKRRELEKYFNRNQQWSLFKYIDRDQSGEIDYGEFKEYLIDSQPSSTSLGAKPTTTVDNGTTDSTAAWGGFGGPRASKYKFASPDVEQTKEKLVRKIISKRRGDKLEDGKWDQTQYLLTAFRSFDYDQSGFLTPDEIQLALGEHGLNLGVKKEQLNKFFNVMDKNDDGMVSYKEFIEFLHPHDIDPSYNPFFDGRRRALMRLNEIATTPYPYQEQHDAALKLVAEREAWLAAAREEKSKRAPTPMDETTVAQLRTQGTVPFAVSANTTGARASEKSLASDQQLSQMDPVGRELALPPRKVGSAEELFADMGRTNAIKMSQICPSILPPAPTDWRRVGYGGPDGIRRDSGLYMSARGQYTTTNDGYFSPLVYEPNRPVVRTAPSDATRDFQARRDRICARRDKVAPWKAVFAEHRRMEQLFPEMDQAQRTIANAKAAYAYNKRATDNDVLRDRLLPPDCMQKRPNPTMAERNLGGSKSFQLHRQNTKEHAMTIRPDSLSYGKTLPEQTSIHLLGGNLPTLHRLGKKVINTKESPFNC